MSEETAVNAKLKHHKVEFLKAYRYPDENNEWQSAKIGDKVDLENRFYDNFKKLGLVKDAK